MLTINFEIGELSERCYGYKNCIRHGENKEVSDPFGVHKHDHNHLRFTEKAYKEFNNQTNNLAHLLYAEKKTDELSPLTNKMGYMVNQALRSYQTQHKGLEPNACRCGARWGTSKKFKDCTNTCIATLESDTLARLIWFDYWVINALELIKEPLIDVYQLDLSKY